MKSSAVEREGGLTSLARLVSILGHPLLLMPAAGLAAWITRNGLGTQAMWIAVTAGLAAIVVLGYSHWPVRRGAWVHVDASGRGERRHLNGFLLAVFAVAASAGAVLRWPQPVTLSLLLAAAMVSVAMLFASWCKPSLHLAFAVFAAALLHAISIWALAAGLVAAIVIAWSRLYLRRHIGVDLWCGAAIGAAAGFAFWLALARGIGLDGV